MKLLQLVFSCSLVIVSTAVPADETEATKRLRGQSAQFQEALVKVSDGVFTSVGTSVSSVSMIFGGGSDGVVAWDAEASNVIWQHNDHPNSIESLASSRDGKYLITASYGRQDPQRRCWHAYTYRKTLSLRSCATT